MFYVHFTLCNFFPDEERPNDSEVLKETEEVFSKHKQDIHYAVFEVIKRLVHLTHFISQNQV